MESQDSSLHNLDKILATFRNELSHATTPDAVRIALARRIEKGAIYTINSALEELNATTDKKSRGDLGKKINELKKQMESEADLKIAELTSKSDSKSDFFDVTIPGHQPKIGHLAVDTEFIRKMNDYFIYNGYSIAEGQDIDSDEYNFEKTNLPKDHPSRDIQDTIYIESPEILLRTQTSNVEARILTEAAKMGKLPVRFVVPGVVFRNEILSPSNHSIFYQYQGCIVDKGINMANLKATLEGYVKHIYGEDTKSRFRTKYYPEVEPGAGMDILCKFCNGEGTVDGQGCPVCKKRGWLEILGCGMIHRRELEMCGIDYNVWTGFAFGMGIDRMIMAKHHIGDLRLLHGGNLAYEDSI